MLATGTPGWSGDVTKGLVLALAAVWLARAPHARD
jgi:hypothetical protein